MRVRLSGLAVLVACLVIAPASAAAGGGWWTYIDLDKDPIAVGETVTATARVMFDSTAQAQEAEEHGDYHAYLVRGIDREGLDNAMSQAQVEGWWTAPEEAIHLGAVDVSEATSNLATATARFTVPEVDAGMYGLMFCTAHCADSMADVVPLQDVVVHDDALLAHMVRTLESWSAGPSQLSLLEGRIDALQADVRELRAEVGDVADAATVDAPASLPSGAPDPAVSPVPVAAEVAEPTSTSGWIPLAGAFLAGAALAGLVMARARSTRSSRPAPSGGVRTITADLDPDVERDLEPVS